MVRLFRTEIDAVSGHEVVERRISETTPDRTCRQIPRPDQHDSILVTILKRAEEPGAILFDWTTECESILLAIERRRLVESAIERRRQTLQTAVAKVKRTGAV